MRKVLLSFCMLLATLGLEAQTFSNAGMESWRTGTSGTGPVVSIAAPTSWYGFDSLVVSLGEVYGSIMGFGSDWHAQLFHETTLVHSGSAAAKVMTVKQDSLGFFGGMLSNAVVNVDMAVLIAGGNPMDAITYSGGTPVTMRVTSVSAYVAYAAGIDSATGTMGGTDEGLLTVQAIATVAGADSIVGVGSANITPSATYYQVTAGLTYSTTDYPVHTVRVIFLSGGAVGPSLDSSTLYVDDVTMEGVPNAVANVSSSAAQLSFFPNPANNELRVDGQVPAGALCSLYSPEGRLVLQQPLHSHTVLNISGLAGGLYYYVVSAGAGSLQRGSIAVVR